MTFMVDAEVEHSVVTCPVALLGGQRDCNVLGATGEKSNPLNFLQSSHLQDQGTYDLT